LCYSISNSLFGSELRGDRTEANIFNTMEFHELDAYIAVLSDIRKLAEAITGSPKKC
jgi:hypothetical protein